MLLRNIFKSTRQLTRHFRKPSVGIQSDRDKQQSAFFYQLLKDRSISSEHDWNFIRKEFLDHYTYIPAENIDPVVLNVCLSLNKYNMGFQYLEFLKLKKSKLNLAIIGQYFKLYYAKKHGEGLSDEDEQQIFDLYKKLRIDYPILDIFSLEAAILGISVTKNWEKCLELVDEIKKFDTPNAAAYSAIISAAFLNLNYELGWKLLDEMLDKERTPQDIVFTSYLKSCEKNNKKEQIKKLENLFQFLHKSELITTENAAKELAAFAKKLNKKHAFTSIDKRGSCQHCKQKLRKFELTNDEFNSLKACIFKNVIVGKDLYNKTTPEELENFKKFVSNLNNYDIVIDGLNVAYSAGTKQHPKVYCGILFAVVDYFAKQGKSILLLGRKHMVKWPKKYWNEIAKSCTIFLAENVSQDDPYLLYCALQSGKDTVIITRDLMRSHKFLLKESQLKVLFARWLSQRQYQLLYAEENKKPFFKYPLSYSVMAQKNGHCWHIPYVMSDKNKNEPINTWLCIEL